MSNLAETMLLEKAGGEPVDIDDDPDMDDWGNLSDDDEDGPGQVEYAEMEGLVDDEAESSSD